MKKHVILLLFIFQVIAIKAQITETKTGPIIDGYGSYFDIKSALSDTAYQKLYAAENPNSELIAKLKKANVEIYVCGQSFLFSKYNLNDVSENVNVSLSALTALVEFQNKGYQIINFN